ncbi:major facilitator superfamily protein [Actinidia rufa]|uniref:Major facilitator superfamily protein n=1 Tax=Actinidia rufa TaxID=165716 RepID=A0A7J0ED74_9ERIC|nr:major facilitator superfamily protein [Actinidia rufa]
MTPPMAAIMQDNTTNEVILPLYSQLPLSTATPTAMASLSSRTVTQRVKEIEPSKALDEKKKEKQTEHQSNVATKTQISMDLLVIKTSRSTT